MGRRRTKAAPTHPDAAATTAGPSGSDSVPMAPLPTKPSSNPNPLPKKIQKRPKKAVDGRRRNIAEQLQQMYGSAAALEADIARHKRLHFKPVVGTQTTQKDDMHDAREFIRS
ncbi:hypothetical protein BJ138DRAFT_1130437 [Hygrophoropsis aurantiaca]|uniref:Uncharacterized protein n=1 Tax=Hygrophoropsis aurantiaca TaxID=72124 RepID=A0ACB7ZY03_9AGAM|nr:hypothetical protein BJ138DRAFT_1130437 [Hygrophoropsis aurantiaca]